ncbi:MAG: heavy metal translocating P-type ATPase [Planctomycetes bacterium]|nr:heavy metal translocating P-type ATPase [Planctomycetota bacterium]
MSKLSRPQIKSIEVSCDHCNLPVPSGLIEPEAELQFCCAGCKAVWQAIHGSGLGNYYRLRASQGVDGTKVRLTGRGYVEFDDPSFEELHVEELDDGTKRTVFLLEGVHCAACVWLIEKFPSIHAGVLEARLDFGRRTAEVRWQPEQAKLSAIAHGLDRLGYPPHPFRGGEDEKQRRLEVRGQLIRIGVAGALAMNCMLLAFALYGGWFHGMDAKFRDFFRWISFGLALLSVVWPGRVFMRGAAAALRTRTAHMDLPIAIGLLAGLLGGAWNTYTGQGEVYFESVTTLVFLLLAGRFLQQRQQRRAYDALAMLYSLTPGNARLMDGDQIREVPVTSLQCGNLLEIRSGDSVPADGVLRTGKGSFDLSLLTGESKPVRLKVGDRVHAGTVSCSDRVVMEVERTGAETRLGRLMQLVERHSNRAAPIVHLADQWSGWFVMTVLVLAVANYFFWLQTSSALALEYTMALLIVACPCALGLATPLAVAAAVGRAAQNGILVKGGDVVERLSHPGILLLDKTGTLTRGEISVVDFAGPKRAKSRIAALESHSSHPYAKALMDAFGAAERNITDSTAGSDGGDSHVDTREEIQGSGMRGVIDGQLCLLGSMRFMNEQQQHLPAELKHAVEQFLDRALTPILYAEDGLVIAVAGLGDALREDAKESLQQLKASGWEIGILSGDHPRIVAAIAKELGLQASQCHGAVAPEEKLQWIHKHQSDPNRPVVMVGDGVNDAAALAAAGVGVAVQGGAEASLAAADVFLARPGLKPLVELIQGSSRTVTVIKGNLLLSLGYNTLGVILAMGGMLSPALAAILMPVSSLTVISTSYRARTFRAAE